jgi:hypothetical protein
MTFASPLGLLALLAIPAIVAIHLLRRRFPVRPVAGLFLWQAAHEIPDGGRRIDKLPWTLSLLLECLAALALALLIAGAALAPAASSEHLVVLLDDSVSMTAIDSRSGDSRSVRLQADQADQAATPRVRAIARVRDEVSRIGPRGRITIVRSGERPALIVGPAAFSAEAESALAAWTPEARRHSLSAGLRLARELAGESGSLLILSDRRPDGTSERIVPGETWAAVGVALPNVGIVDAHRSVDADTKQGRLSLTVRNYSDAPARRVLRLVRSTAERTNESSSPTELLARNVDVAVGTSSISIPLPAAIPAVRVALSDDALLSDNAAVLVEPRPQVVVVDNRLSDGRGRSALEKALGALAGIVQGSPAHLAFLDAGTAPSPGVWQARFGRPPPPLAREGPSEDLIGPFVLEKRHPLLQGVTLAGVVWTGVVPLDPGGAHPLASGGDRALIASSAQAAGAADPTFLFNVDLERTNLIRSPDWPILISNLVEMRRRELPGPERWNYRVGEWVRVRFDRQPAAPLRLRMGAFTRDLPATRLVEFVAPAPGGLAQVLEGDQVRYEIGINPLDEAEGDLRRASTETIGTFETVRQERALESGPAFDPLFWLLLATCTAAMFGNWWLLSPRRVRA